MHLGRASRRRLTYPGRQPVIERYPILIRSSLNLDQPQVDPPLQQPPADRPIHQRQRMQPLEIPLPGKRTGPVSSPKGSRLRGVSPSPFAGEGAPQGRMRGELSGFAQTPPSSGRPGHLLPRGEKGCWLWGGSRGVA